MKTTGFDRAQRGTIITGIAAFVVIIVVMQLWLFTVTMEAFLGGESGIALPAALASLASFLLNLGLFFYVRRLATGK
jgi:uncharacterized membrane-anchored protein